MVLTEKTQPVEIDFNLPMTGVDTFTQVEIDLPVNVQTGLVFDIDLIEMMITPEFDPLAAGQTSVDVNFTFNSQAAILGWNNNDMIASENHNAHASAALLHSGKVISRLHIDTRGRANLIARTSIFLGIDSTNCTVVQRTQGRIIGSLVKIDQKALTQLVLNQLT